MRFPTFFAKTYGEDMTSAERAKY